MPILSKHDPAKPVIQKPFDWGELGGIIWLISLPPVLFCIISAGLSDKPPWLVTAEAVCMIIFIPLFLAGGVIKFIINPPLIGGIVMLAAGGVLAGFAASRFDTGSAGTLKIICGLIIMVLGIVVGIRGFRRGRYLDR